jgi:hypothetical protein
MLTDRSDAEFPFEYTSLHQLLETLPPGRPTLEEVEKGVFARAVTIRPGGSVRKLLAFPGPRDGNFKRMQILVGALHLPGGDLDAIFRYRRFKEDS